MAGGKRSGGKPRFTGQIVKNSKAGHAQWRWLGRAAQAKQQLPPGETIETRDRKRDRQPESDSEGSDVLPKQKKTKLSRSNAATSGIRSSQSAQDSFPHEGAQKVARDFIKKSSREDGHDPSAQSPSPETAPIVALASELQDEPSAKPVGATTDQRDTVLPKTPSSSTHSNLPPSGPETFLVEDLTSPHADPGIPFGRLQCLKDPKVFFALRKPDDGPEAESILFGYDRRGCDVVVSGPAQGIGYHHCYLNLELSRPDSGPLRRRVVVSKIHADPSLRTTIWIGGVPYPVEDELDVPPGAIIQFGNGEKYAYYGPEFSALYFQEQEIHDHANSGVTRVKRITDRRLFVAKRIRKSHSKMAKTEVAVYRALKSHPRIVQFVEAFHEGFSGAHHLILEAGEMDLHQYASRMRARGQKILTANAPRWIEHITRGLEYLHRHNIAHRDMKPKNIIVFISKNEGLTMKLGDMGIARPNTEPVIDNWRAGTNGWMAPGSFMAYGDDRFTDCYGVGRLLFFLLTTHRWPEESRKANRTCNCPNACDGPCIRRQSAFQVLKAAGAGEEALDFLRRLLVGVPDDCMNSSEMLDHAYLADASSGEES